jgi:hypothetical protein
MKIKILILFMLIPSLGIAQRHFKGIDAVEFKTGSRIFGSTFDLSAGGAYSKYINYKSYYKIAFDVMTTDFFLYKDEIKSRSISYFLSGDYAYSFFAKERKHESFFLNAYGGLFIGVETFNLGKYRKANDFKYPYIEFDGSYKNRLVAGIEAGIEMEYFFSDRIGVIFNLKEMYSPFRKLSEWETVATAGIKYILM